MDELSWSEWYQLTPPVVNELVPDLPGIYETRIDHTFGRLSDFGN